MSTSSSSGGGEGGLLPDVVVHSPLSQSSSSSSATATATTNTEEEEEEEGEDEDAILQVAEDSDATGEENSKAVIWILDCSPIFSLAVALMTSAAAINRKKILLVTPKADFGRILIRQKYMA